MQSRIFQSSAKFMHPKKQNTNLVYLYIHLVETFALILNSKIVFQELFLIKVIDTKKTLLALNPLIPSGNNRSHILTTKPTPFICRFV